MSMRRVPFKVRKKAPRALLTLEKQKALTDRQKPDRNITLSLDAANYYEFAGSSEICR